MENIQTFQIKSRYLKSKIFVTVNILLLVLFDFFYCDIFTNMYATVLVFIVMIILIVVTVQCCRIFLFSSIFFNGLKSGPVCSNAS